MNGATVLQRPASSRPAGDLRSKHLADLRRDDTAFLPSIEVTRHGSRVKWVGPVIVTGVAEVAGTYMVAVHVPNCRHEEHPYVVIDQAAAWFGAWVKDDWGVDR